MSLHGMESLKRAFAQTPDVVKNRLAQAVASSTFSVAQAIRANAWRNTGALASGITSRFSGLTGRVEISVDAFYWPFLEYGTVKMAARPVIRPAAEQESTVFERRIVGVARSLEQDFDRKVA